MKSFHTKSQKLCWFFEKRVFDKIQKSSETCRNEKYGVTAGEFLIAAP